MRGGEGGEEGERESFYPHTRQCADRPHPPQNNNMLKHMHAHTHTKK